MLPSIYMIKVSCLSDQRKYELDSNDWKMENDKILKLCKYSGRGMRIS